MKNLKYLLIIGLTFLPTKGFNQAPCDSSSFEQLIKIRDSKAISDYDLKKCCCIVDSLLEMNCTYFILKREYQNYFKLTSIFGEICLKANSLNSVKAYIDYYLKNSNSPEEQICYSLEDIFIKRPKDVLSEISNRNSTDRDVLLFGLAFGFGENYSENTPIDTNNYKKVFYSLNSEIVKIYPTYQKEIDNILLQIKNMLTVTERMKNKN
jgi:hypothetical protein